MAVTEESPLASSVANGVTTVFPHSFTVLDAGDLVVKGELAGVVTTYVSGVDYTVSGVGTNSGSVTFGVAPANGTVVTRYRDMTLTRETDYQDNGDLLADVVNADLDRLVFMVQDIFAGGKGPASAVRAPNGEALQPLPSAGTRALSLLAFDALGQPTISVPASGTAADVLLRLANVASASEGPALMAFTPTLNYAAGTIGQALRQRIWCITDYPWNAVGDDATDNYAAILAAQTALAAAGGGTLLIPRGNFRYNTAIPRVSNVDYEGVGWSSVLKPVACSAFTYGYVSGFDQSRTANLAIEAVTGGSQIGIYQAGTLNNADELYGILIQDCAIRGFNIAMKFRTVRNVSIFNNWIQDCNSGLHLIGQCIVTNVFGNKFVFAAGSGSGTQTGVLCDSFNYTSGTGIVRPETVCIQRNIIYGYTNAIDFTGVVFGTVRDNDLQATGQVIFWSTAAAPIVIESNYIELVGAAAVRAVYGGPQSSAIDTSVIIRGNHFSAVGTPAATSVGLQLGDAGNGNQDNVRVENNSFFGFTKYDIAFYKSGHITVRGNQCYSTAVTNSIFCTALAANRPSYVSENDCYSTIAADAGDIASGLLQLGKNIINQTTVDYGNAGYSGWITQAYASGDFTAAGAMSWTVASGDLAVFDYRILGKEMLANIIINTSTVGGTVNSPLKIKIPGGRSCSRRAINACHILDNGVRQIAYFEVDPAGDATQINVSKADGSNWTLSTDNTYVRGQLTIPLV